MFDQRTILIVEDEPLIAIALATEVETLDGQVAGPAPTVAEALEILASQNVEAAILDANLADRDVTPVGLLLAERGIPFVIHSGVGIPSELSRAIPRLQLVLKPAPPYAVMANLLSMIAGRKAEERPLSTHSGHSNKGPRLTQAGSSERGRPPA